MNNNEIKVLVTKVGKTKNGKSILTYLTKQKDSTYSKGLDSLQQWFDDDNLFNKLNSDDMPITCKATYMYEPTYNGIARMKLLTLVDSNGKDLLA